MAAPLPAAAADAGSTIHPVTADIDRCCHSMAWRLGEAGAVNIKSRLRSILLNARPES